MSADKTTAVERNPIAPAKPEDVARKREPLRFTVKTSAPPTHRADASRVTHRVDELGVTLVLQRTARVGQAHARLENVGACDRRAAVVAPEHVMRLDERSLWVSICRSADPNAGRGNMRASLI